MYLVTKFFFKRRMSFIWKEIMFFLRNREIQSLEFSMNIFGSINLYILHINGIVYFCVCLCIVNGIVHAFTLELSTPFRKYENICLITLPYSVHTRCTVNS